MGRRRAGPYGARGSLDALRGKYLGAFAEVLGIKPWQWKRLLYVEVIGLCDYIDRRNEAMKQGA